MDDLSVSTIVKLDTTITVPSASGNVVQYIGTAISSSEFSFEATDGVILA